MKSYSKHEIVQMLCARRGVKTLQDFAAEIGVSRATLSHAMHGKIDPPKKILSYLRMHKIKELRYEPWIETEN